MGNVKKNYNERRKYRVSRYQTLRGYIIMVFLFITSFYMYVFDFYSRFFVIPAVIGLIILIALEIKILSTSIVLENDNFVIRRGFISKDKTRIPYHSITRIKMYQSIFQRIFGCGDIEITSPGSTIQQIQHFKGTGNVNVSGEGLKQHELRVKNFRNIKSLESGLMSKIHASARGY